MSLFIPSRFPYVKATLSDIDIVIPALFISVFA